MNHVDRRAIALGEILAHKARTECGYWDTQELARVAILWMDRNPYQMPTLRDCAKDVKSFKDAWDFFPLLVPMPLWRLGKALFHPRRWWYMRKKNKWCYSRKVGDIICDCRGVHTAIKEVREDNDTIVTLDGNLVCSLYNCCSEPEPDNSCHHILKEETQP